MTFVKKTLYGIYSSRNNRYYSLRNIQRKHTCSNILDIFKAFDSLDKDTLLYKLNYYFIKNSELNCFKIISKIDSILQK